VDQQVFRGVKLSQMARDDVQSGVFEGSHPVPGAGPTENVDEKESKNVHRFVGNMLAVRLGRAGVQTIASSAKLPFYLSPWGDNNPVTLPNVRKRDIALAGVMHVSMGALAPSSALLVHSGHAVTWTAEQAVHEGIHKIHGGGKPHEVTTRVGLVSLAIRIQHKLIGQNAELVFFGARETVDKTSCSKGWFCPYLYASGRTPQVPRSKDFTMAQFIGPGLVADASIAPIILNTLHDNDTAIVSFCPWQADAPNLPPFRRVALFVLGISPYRTANMWSQARIPNEARLSFHLLTHIPAIVLPVTANTPVLAWSPRTLRQILEDAESSLGENLHADSGDGTAHLGPRADKPNRYDSSRHCNELRDSLDTVVDESIMDVEWRGRWREEVGGCIKAVIDRTRGSAEAVRGGMASICDLERAGIVVFRY